MEILDKIRLLRKLKNINQKIMAENLFMSEGGYNKIENGETELTMQKLAEIAKILGVSTQDLVNNSAINIVFVQEQANQTSGIVNNSQDSFIEYLKSELNRQRQEIEDKNLLIQGLKQEIANLKQQNNQK